MTQPNLERVAVARLVDQGFECYMPRYKATRFVGGKRHKVPALLFPRYLFLYVVDVWRSVLSTRGVHKVLLDNGVPAKLPTKFVDGLKAQEDKEGFVRVADPTKYKKGQKLRMKSLDSLVIYDGPAHERETVLLAAMGRMLRVTCDPADLEAV